MARQTPVGNTAKPAVPVGQTWRTVLALFGIGLLIGAGGLAVFAWLGGERDPRVSGHHASVGGPDSLGAINFPAHHGEVVYRGRHATDGEAN